MAPSRISPGAAVRHLLSRGAGVVVGYQRWHDLLFLHWEVPPEAVRPLVDPRLALDLLDGRAWLSLTPFTVRGARLRGLPPLVAAFHEVNLRTYVRPDGGQPGIWFASLDAASALASAAARASLGLPYFPARIDRGETGVEHHYRCDRVALRGEGASLSARWTVGAPVENRPGSVEHFLAERYALYTVHLGRLLRVRVRHQPWPVREARIGHLRETLSRAAGLPEAPASALAQFSPGVDVEFFPPEVLG